MTRGDRTVSRSTVGSVRTGSSGVAYDHMHHIGISSILRRAIVKPLSLSAMSTTQKCVATASGAARRLGSSSSASAPKLWGGRFTEAVDPLMEQFNSSIEVDKRMWKQDVEGSQAYAKALERAGLLTAEEQASIDAGLEQCKEEWASGTFDIRPSDEDVHTANERRLTEIIGSTGGKLHTGRSRNDQVATDVRLWLKEEIEVLQANLVELIKISAHRARDEVDILMPGYTHLQPAQPIRWSHWIMSYVAAWKRDMQRLQDLKSRVDVMPLGSGALAGNPFQIDRQQLGKDLGFADISLNSLDAVSDRDFIAEFLFWSTMTQVHLSRFAEDLIVYSTKEFGYVTLSDRYSTGSSLMPQKKNPDALELLRGKTGSVLGSLTSLLVALKGLPSTYNKDLQEDKQHLFTTSDTMNICIQITTGVLATLTPNPDRMRAALVPEMLATDFAEYLVRKGVAFRDSHHIAGAAVALAEDTNTTIDKLTVEQLQGLHAACEVVEADVVDIWNMDVSVDSRSSAGGTSRDAVLNQVDSVLEWLDGQN